MAKITNEIIKWAKAELPKWEQLALSIILRDGQTNEDTFKEIYSCFLIENGLCTGDISDIEKCLQEDEGHEETTERQIKLISVTNEKGVNALIEGETLSFGPNLNLVYGENRAGKSGYVRAIASMSFSRGDKFVLPDVSKELDDGEQSLGVCVDVGGEIKKWSQHPTLQNEYLGQFYVFDDTSVLSHLGRSQKLAYSPSGLSCLTSLAKVVQNIKDRLWEDINRKKQRQINVDVYFGGSSETLSLLKGCLDHGTLDELKTLATFTEEDNKAFTQLSKRLLELQSGETEEKRKKLGLISAGLSKLSLDLDKWEKLTAQESISSAYKLMERKEELEKILKKVSLSEFKHEQLKGIGSDEWIEFVVAAKSLAEIEATGAEYPKEDDVCLLCHQKLSDSSRNLLKKLWVLLGDETKKELNEILERIKRQIVEFGEPIPDLLNTGLSHVEYLVKQDRSKFDALQVEITVFEERKRLMLSWLTGNVKLPREIPVSETPDSPNFEPEMKGIAEQIKTLDLIDTKVELISVNNSLNNLKHKKSISSELDKWNEQRKNGRVIAKAESISPINTRHITEKYNSLFGELVTKEYLESFSSKLSQLGFPDMVKPQITGQVGEAFKQIVLSSGSKEDHNLSQILSGGEKRLIALADFLAEVSTNKRSQGIILDDPMTSLDATWQEEVASLLVMEAKTRQVIIFTHNLKFLSDLIASIEENKLSEVSFAYISRGNDDKPGHIENGISPVLESKVLNAKEVQECIDEVNSGTMTLKASRRRLGDGFADLRQCYESLVIFKVLNSVVQRYNPRLSVGSLEKAANIMREPGLVEKVISKYDYISELTAHLRSDAYHSGLPLVTDLEKELLEYHALKKQIDKLPSKF